MFISFQITIINTLHVNINNIFFMKTFSKRKKVSEKNGIVLHF